MDFLGSVLNAVRAAFTHIFTGGVYALAPALEGEALTFAHTVIDHYTPNNETAALAKSLVESGIENAQAHSAPVSAASETIKASAQLAQATIPHINPPTETVPGPFNGD